MLRRYLSGASLLRGVNGVREKKHTHRYFRHFSRSFFRNERFRFYKKAIELFQEVRFSLKIEAYE